MSDWSKKEDLPHRTAVISVVCHFAVDMENFQVKYISSSYDVLRGILDNENRNHIYKETKILSKVVTLEVPLEPK